MDNLYETLRNQLLPYARSKLRFSLSHMAEDVVQDVLVMAWVECEDSKDQLLLRTPRYYRCVSNKCAEAIRRGKKEHQRNKEIKSLGIVTNVLTYNLDTDKIKDKMTKDEWLVAVYRGEQQMAWKGVAEKTGKTIAQVKWIWGKIKKYFKEALQEDEF